MKKKRFIIKGLFDINPRLEGLSVRGIQIMMIEELEDFIKENNIEIATLTIPKDKAGDMADMLVKYGIKAIWNFAHVDLQVPDDVVVENVHLSDSLMTLSYKLSCYEIESQKKM